MPTNIDDLAALTQEEMNEVRDIIVPMSNNDENGDGIPDFDLDNAICYCADVQPRRLFNDTSERFIELTALLNTMEPHLKAGKERFRLEHKGVAYRAEIGERPHGSDITLRALPKETPLLNKLHFQIPAVRTILNGSALLNGGLVIISGQNGNGKSTTMAATVATRLGKHGGHCNTVEDPIELPLDGIWKGERVGYCAQRPADRGLLGAENKEGGYKRSLYKAARQFPSFTGGGTILMIGEIRDEETAIEAINAAVAGHLVLSTIHSPSAAAAVDRLVTLATRKQGVSVESIRELVANHLTGVIHQRLAYDTKNPMGPDWFDLAVIKNDVLMRDERDGTKSKVAMAIMDGSSGLQALSSISAKQTANLSKLKIDDLTPNQVRDALNELS